MGKKFFLFIISLVLLLPAHAAERAEDLFLDEIVFKEGEKAKFNLYYNWGFIWIHAGDVDFNVSKKKYGGKDVFSLMVAGYTTKTFDKMYTIRDTFESYIDPQTMYPFYYRESKHEDSYTAQIRYVYRLQENDSMRVAIDRKKRSKHMIDTLVVSKHTADLIASCYKIRNIDVKNLKKDQIVPFSMVFDNEIYELGLKYKGKENIKLRNGKKYKALKFMPTLITGDLFENEDDMAVYVSDDDNHIPLLIEAKIKVGSVKAMLNTIENPKYPLSSLIKN